MSLRIRFAPAALACLLLLSAGAERLAAAPDPARVLPEGRVPKDRRLEKQKDLNGYFPMAVPKTKTEWETRAADIRRRVLVANGLWPMPELGPPKAIVHGKVDRDDFTVEKVILESYPGYYVTGSLFRPKGKPGKHAAVLCPHGHWPNGRYFDHGPQEIRKQIAMGAERFEESGRYPLQARCVHLARMGCVVFHYDMAGYADSKQLSFELVHRFGKQRPELDTPDRWGFFGAQAESRLQSVMGVQTYDSIRALDFVCSLPDVDPARIGVTGASGGGTQTFILCAVDPRPAVSVPAVMVSTSMQGGCTCENCSLLRVGTGNIELAGLFAPKPLGMTSADDWTKEMKTKGMPELTELYKLYGVEQKVALFNLLQFPHNYNAVSRMAMYNWMNKHLDLGQVEPVIERDFVPLSAEELKVWDADHPEPPGGDEFEVQLTKTLVKISNDQLDEIAPRDSVTLGKFREVVGGAFDVILNREPPDPNDIQREKVFKEDRGEYFLFKDLLRYVPAGEELPVLFLLPKEWKGEVAIWLEGDGKAALLSADGSPRGDIARLLKAGVAVASADLIYQGEFLADGKPLAEAPATKTYDRDFAGYTYGYNDSLFAQRVADVLTLAVFCRNYSDHRPEKLHLVGLDGAGPIAAAAKAQAGALIDSTVVDTAGFRFRMLPTYRDLNFLPGSVKYGDLPALLALGAPGKLLILGEKGQVPPLTQAAYAAAGQQGAVASKVVLAGHAAEAAIDWLTKK